MIDTNILNDIPFFTQWDKIEQIKKGWSSDKKYYIESKNGNKLLLRISDIGSYDSKKKEFISMQEVYKLGINMSEPLDFGRCGNSSYVYSLFSWIEGKATDEIISELSEKEQYQYGLKAGKVLKKMHSISAPLDQEDWEKRMIIKINRHLEEYDKCEYRVKNDGHAINYIKNNLHLLKNRPQNYQHGDYHIGNMVITKNNELGIIDFNRWGFGDNYHEFYKMMIFSRELSIPFALGQMDGYFENKIPKDFFDILALYVADVILFSIVWAIPFGMNDIKGMIKRAEIILDDYDNFKTTIPKWFKEDGA